MIRVNRLPLAGLMLLACGGNAWAAAECRLQRGFAGVEGVGALTSGSLWKFDDPAFRNNAIANLYLTSVARCTLGDTLSVKGQASGAYTQQARTPGDLEDKRQQGVAILNELVASLTLRDNLYLDLGKLRHTSGYLFSRSPLDVLRNVSGGLRTARVYATGDSWRGLYDEGSYGAGGTLYRKEGTYTLAVLPRLRRFPQRREAASEWDALLRTNGSERYYASYTSTGLNKFNPTISLLAGQQKTLALGTSGNLSDSLIFSIEGALSHGETWRHLDSRYARGMREDLIYREEAYRINGKGVEGEIGVGLRYTTAEQTEFGVEYYGQSQGYSRSEWRNNTDTIKFVNGGYANILDPFWLPVVRDSFQQYSRLMAAENTNVSRSGNLFGKHYLTLYTRTNKERVGEIDWSVSSMANLIDYSTVLNVHLRAPMKNNIELYAGALASFGRRDSEFGIFGEKGNLYAGMRISW